MASETAKLVASLTLKDGLTKPLATASKALNGFDTKLATTQTRVGRGAAQVTAGVVTAAKIAVVGIGAVTGLLLASAKEGQEAANVQKLYADAIARSGKVSGAQVAALNAQQEAILNLTGADDELIKTEQTRLINMGLTGDAVAKLIPLIQDAAAATGKDVESITTAVGKAALGNTGALAKLGIIIPKTTAATKSAALVALERQKAELAVAKSLDASHGALTKAEKATYAQKAAALDAAIGQQKLNDATKTGVKGTDDLTAVTDALSKSFKGAAASTSGSLDTRLKVLNERLANVREEAGIKLLPALTRIVDVVGSKLVPAFGKFIDAVLPTAISGLDKLAGFLEGGGATSAITSFLNTAKAVMPVIQRGAEVTGQVIKTAVDMFRSLPPEIQSLAVAGLAINKLTGGLVTNIAGGLISAVISSFKGMMNVNAAVVNVNGAVGGGLPGGLGGAAAAGGAGALLTSTVVIAGVVAATYAFLQTYNGPKAMGAFTPTVGSAFAPATVKPSDFSGIDWATIAHGLNGPGTSMDDAARAAMAAANEQQAAGNTMDEAARAAMAASNAQTRAAGASIAAARKLSGPEVKAVIAGDRAARGIRAGGISTSLAPRINFLRGNASGGKDVAVSAAIALGFERGATPLFRDTKQIPRAIKALQRDQSQLLKHGDTKNAGIIGGHIARLKAELSRREQAVKAAVDAKKLSANVNVNMNTSLLVNGRVFQTNVNRFSTSVTARGGNFDMGGV